MSPDSSHQAPSTPSATDHEPTGAQVHRDIDVIVTGDIMDERGGGTPIPPGASEQSMPVSDISDPPTPPITDNEPTPLIPESLPVPVVTEQDTGRTQKRLASAISVGGDRGERQRKRQKSGASSITENQPTRRSSRVCTGAAANVSYRVLDGGKDTGVSSGTSQSEGARKGRSKKTTGSTKTGDSTAD